MIEGDDIERMSWSPGWYTVLLTPWDAGGLPNSTTDSLRIYCYRCEGQQHPNPITPKGIRSVAGPERYPSVDESGTPAWPNREEIASLLGPSSACPRRR